jgi:hypothetical protein
VRPLRLIALTVAAVAICAAAVGAAFRGPTRAAEPSKTAQAPVAGLDEALGVAQRAAGPAAELVDPAVVELAARLRGDPARLRGRAIPGSAEADGLAVARRMQRRLCPPVWRDECHLAMARAAIRQTWRRLRRSPTRRRQAEVVLGVGIELGMTSRDVVDAVRAELDTQLTREVAAGTRSEQTLRRALACFDRLRGCDRV